MEEISKIRDDQVKAFEIIVNMCSMSLQEVELVDQLLL